MAGIRRKPIQIKKLQRESHAKEMQPKVAVSRLSMRWARQKYNGTNDLCKITCIHAWSAIAPVYERFDKSLRVPDIYPDAGVIQMAIIAWLSSSLEQPRSKQARPVREASLRRTVPAATPMKNLRRRETM